MKSFTLLLFLALPNLVFAQNADDIKKFENLFGHEKHTHDWSDQLRNNKNEVDFLFSAVFIAYKELLSSQDVDACVFTPSCSVYAIETIKKNGILIGYLDAVDRMTRCNPGRNKNLPINIETGRYADPVQSRRPGKR
jgi:uncharacterized protein